MTHNEKNIANYHAGDSLKITVDVEETNGDPVDLTGASATYLIKENMSDPDTDALVELTTSSGDISIVDATAGRLEVHIPTGETSGMTGQKHHRVRITDDSGNRSTVLTGTITIIV